MKDSDISDINIQMHGTNEQDMNTTPNHYNLPA